jgi:hypothetical protein
MKGGTTLITIQMARRNHLRKFIIHQRPDAREKAAS